jgi:multicomponent Na+:H+ antiporter subunit B
LNSLVLSTGSRALKPVLLAASVLVLLRGHHEPGGGFAGGLLAAAAFAFQAFASGVPTARRSLRVPLHLVIGSGLAMVLTTAAAPLALGEPLLTTQYTKLPWGWGVGTTLLFDAGVYLVVLGTVLLVIFNLAEEEQ